MSAKVSVIVPIYNAANTLTDCLSSLVFQSLKDIEIILVNDCSTDDSLRIMSDCESQFSDKIILVNSDINRGAGGARNIGLMYASGEYIGFMDSDDIATLEMYEKLYNKAKENDYDIVDCGYYNEAKDNALLHTTDELSGILDDHKRSELIVSGGYFWSRIFRKSFLDEISLTFREKCILEDMETLMLTFAKAKSVGNIQEILYNYRNNPASISKKVDATSYCKSTFAAADAVYNTLSVLDNYEGIKAAVEYSIANLAALSINACESIGANDPAFIQKSRFDKIKAILKDYVTISLEDNIYIRNKISKEDIAKLKRLEAN